MPCVFFTAVLLVSNDLDVNYLKTILYLVKTLYCHMSMSLMSCNNHGKNGMDLTGDEIQILSCCSTIISVLTQWKVVEKCYMRHGRLQQNRRLICNGCYLRLGNSQHWLCLCSSWTHNPPFFNDKKNLIYPSLSVIDYSFIR